MAYNSFETVKHTVTFRRSKDDPQERKDFGTSEAAYKFAIDIETNGGITMVTASNVVSIAQVRSTKLSFEE